MSAEPAFPSITEPSSYRFQQQTPPALSVDIRTGASAAAWPWVAAFAGVAAAGALLRLAGLGYAPFAPAEAANAWPALRDALAQPVEGMPAPVSALLYSLHFLLFWVAGTAGEVLARVPVALLASLMPALAWFWRDRLTNAGALLLALLLAIDPWGVTFARMADSAGLSASLALLTLTALHVASMKAGKGASAAGNGPTGWSLEVAAVGAGLLLISGPQAWSWLVIVVLGALLVGPPLGMLATARLGLLAGAAALLGATAFFAHPERLAVVASSIGAWGAQALPGIYPIGHPWLRLVIDQPLLLLLAILGGIAVVGEMLLVQTTRRRGIVLHPDEAARTRQEDRFHRLLLLWAAWGALLALAPGRLPDALPLLSTALAFIAAAGMGLAGDRLRLSVPDWREGVLLASVLTAVLLSLLFLVVSIVSSPQWERNNAIVALMLALLAVLLVVGYAALVSPRGALVLGAGVASLFLLGATTASLSDLAFRHDEGHPDGFLATVALHSANNLGTDVARLSDFRAGSSSEMPVVVVSGPSPVPDAQVGWQVRHMRNVTWSVAPPAPMVNLPAAGARMPLVITSSAEGATPITPTAWNATYLGAEYPMRSTWLPYGMETGAMPQAQGESWQERWQSGHRPWLRWLIYREAPAPVAEMTLLWAPAE